MTDRTLYLYSYVHFAELKLKMKSEGKVLIAGHSIKDYAEELPKIPDKYVIDISHWVEFLANHKDGINSIEPLILHLPEKIIFLCDDRIGDIALDIFRFCFSSSAYYYNVGMQESNSKGESTKSYITSSLNNKKIFISLTEEGLISFFDSINTNLIGHRIFKTELEKRLKSFRLFNKLGRQKLFSVFLMGESGIGKTEVGRIMHKALGGEESLCKISFGNYSSKDSLNSLIGSPRGFIGSETGELPLKINKSDVGLILIDEFEKADNPVYNFFLDLLEEGKFSDSMSNVYDLEGYIILFTSNLTPDQYKRRLSPELRSRFDYVCQFQLLTNEEKKDYIHRQIESIIQKFEYKLHTTISEADKKTLYDIDYVNFTNLRKINRVIKEKFASIAPNYID